MQTFHGGHLDKKSIVSLPSSISPHQSTEAMIGGDIPRKYIYSLKLKHNLTNIFQ